MKKVFINIHKRFFNYNVRIFIIFLIDIDKRSKISFSFKISAYYTCY